MRPLRILVAHHDASQRGELAQLLRHADHLVVEAASGPAAADLMTTDTDTLLLDLTAPDLDLRVLQQALRSAGESEPDTLDAAERRHIARVLHYTGGNKRRAALILGISRSTLLNKVRKYGIQTR